jgi:hypothetical protein
MFLFCGFAAMMNRALCEPRLHQQMVVVCQQHPGMHPPAGPRTRLTQGGQKDFPIPIIAKNRFAAITAIEQLIDCTCEL